MACDHCGNEIKPNCDWRQGRCPHREPLLNLDLYQKRYYNLLQSIKNLFRKEK
jgi:hypothetical protein